MMANKVQYDGMTTKCPNCGGHIRYETAQDESGAAAYDVVIAEYCDTCKWRKSLLVEDGVELGQVLRGLKSIVAKLEKMAIDSH